MADVVDQGERLGEVLVQTECGGDGARNLRDFHGVRQAAAKVIGVTVSEDLRLAREAAKGTGMNDAGAVALEG